MSHETKIPGTVGTREMNFSGFKNFEVNLKNFGVCPVTSKWLIFNLLFPTIGKFLSKINLLLNTGFRVPQWNWLSQSRRFSVPIKILCPDPSRERILGRLVSTKSREACVSLVGSPNLGLAVPSHAHYRFYWRKVRRLFETHKEI